MWSILNTQDGSAGCHTPYEQLWINRERLLSSRKVNGLHVVEMSNEVDTENRQLTALRMRLGQQRTQVINKIKRILYKHNLQHSQPPKTFQTIDVARWLRDMPPSGIDRLDNG